ncbi:MAG: RsbRD N-terminal domain-containing protein [Gemmatimonadota bacterium]
MPAPMIGDLLKEQADTIVERWGKAVLSSYHSDAAVLFQRQRDPFANPIGSSVRKGTRGVFQAILNGMDPDELRSHLDTMVRIRAVQEFTPSQALSFIFALRSIIREQIPQLDADPRLHRERIELEEIIDRVALMAFEVYASCREELNDLRVTEMKRQVSWVFEKLGKEMPEGPEPHGLQGSGSPAETRNLQDNGQREDLR